MRLTSDHYAHVYLVTVHICTWSQCTLYLVTVLIGTKHRHWSVRSDVTLKEVLQYLKIQAFT